MRALSESDRVTRAVKAVRAYRACGREAYDKACREAEARLLSTGVGPLEMARFWRECSDAESH